MMKMLQQDAIYNFSHIKQISITLYNCVLHFCVFFYLLNAPNFTVPTYISGKVREELLLDQVYEESRNYIPFSIRYMENHETTFPS
jgi:hypothetical protein